VIADVVNHAIAGIDLIHAVGRVVVRNGFAAGMNIVMTQNGITRRWAQRRERDIAVLTEAS
jgi:DhnA family fructose-bisphosphate aldolase class Ia